MAPKRHLNLSNPRQIVSARASRGCRVSNVLPVGNRRPKGRDAPLVLIPRGSVAERDESPAASERGDAKDNLKQTALRKAAQLLIGSFT